ncbi:hypothetical protein HanXRQr2_Chr09g0376221 [Helianthus annuus]|uniref:Uncharacterized protein n=1 Tax=Helianthus annuus TaxID=4232 RepID=A0A9K3N765_HELAN|nr:hypothetical protein HanXRQr2_Chr09g0376221 [Helianthus annuus]KAJ0525184.1 hypothetical protein HanHA300_Chr09g0309081 [Helianthus annuus]KAJ0892174.1 hypothetical protein HanPSC8_Chr09g0362781 [Helianthus annuus]
MLLYLSSFVYLTCGPYASIMPACTTSLPIKGHVFDGLKEIGVAASSVDFFSFCLSRSLVAFLVRTCFSIAFTVFGFYMCFGSLNTGDISDCTGIRHQSLLRVRQFIMYLL